jgi:integrase
MIYKRGRVYWFAFVFRGVRIQRSTRQGAARKARDMEAEHRTALARGETPPLDRKPEPRSPTLHEIQQRFLDYSAQRTKPGTMRHYAGVMRRLLSFKALAEISLDQIDDSIIERFIQHRRRSVSIAETNRELAVLRRVLTLARKKWRIIHSAPEVSLLPGEKGREYVLPYADERRYLLACQQPLRDLALLCLDTGLRPGEALALKWQDVRLDPLPGARFGLLRVREGKSRASRRVVPLTARVRAMLAERSTGADHVFPSPRGGPLPLTTLDHQHGAVRRRLGFPSEFVPHSWRHTALTRLGEAGAPVWTLARIAGHSTVGLAERYVHPSDEAVERAFVRLESADERGLAKVGEGASGVASEQQPTTVPTTARSIS